MDRKASAHTAFWVGGGDRQVQVRVSGTMLEEALAPPGRPSPPLHLVPSPAPTGGDLSTCEQIPESLMLKIFPHICDQHPLPHHR